MLEDIVRHCQPTTRLHISCNITSKDAMNQTAIMEDWKNNTYDFHKKPAVFVVGR
jgi:16S rRNA (cytidine1402-2'-O)-methyltransferase